MSDSTYVVNCFRDRWWEGWLQRDWKNSQKQAGGQPRPLGAAPGARALATDVPVTFRWVKGHSGDPWNDVVDELATMAADSGRGLERRPLERVAPRHAARLAPGIGTGGER